ncbi:MAG: hypothetical protein KC912_22750 [Proteobacteria bacterium]|nr:hypothetical protein [Pseudomonadota bacterium]
MNTPRRFSILLVPLITLMACGPGDDDTDGEPTETGDSTPPPADVDGDGVTDDEDCDDDDPANFPGNVEDCTDGQDNDCDGLVDLAQAGPGYLLLDDSGAGTYLWLDSGANTDLTGSDFTLELSVKLDSAAGFADEILHSFDETDGQGTSLTMRSRTEDAEMEVAVFNPPPGTFGSWSPILSGGLASDGAWRHVAVVYTSSTDTLETFVNGVSQDTWVLGSTFSGETRRLGRDLLLGNGAPSQWGVHGAVDEVRVWSTARTAAELTGAVCTPLTGTETGLLTSLNFDSSTTPDVGSTAYAVEDAGAATFATW